MLSGEGEHVFVLLSRACVTYEQGPVSLKRQSQALRHPRIHVTEVSRIERALRDPRVSSMLGLATALDVPASSLKTRAVAAEKIRASVSTSWAARAVEALGSAGRLQVVEPRSEVAEGRPGAA